MRLTLEAGQGLIICPPAFGMYTFFAQLGRHRVHVVPRRADFSLDVPAIEACARQTRVDRPRLLFLTSPGNPDGLIIPHDVVQRVLQLPLAVVVDEAYIEYGRPSAAPLLAQQENLIVIRTFSKWAGMAGLRLGYALAAPEIAGGLERIRAPYNVNSAAMVAALATLKDLDSVQANVAALIDERERLQARLAELPWMDVVPSQANFILCRVTGRKGYDVAEALARQGILVRSFSEAHLEGYVRIGVGRPEQNEALMEGLQKLSNRERCI